MAVSSGWPWDYKLEIFGQDLSDTCGALAVKFVTLETGDEVDFIAFDMDTGMMTLQPDLSTQPNIYALKMQVYLADYPSVVVEEAFVATVLSTENCLYDKITFGNNIAATTYTFSNPVNTLTVDP